MIPFKLLLITDWSREDCLSQIGEALKAGPGIAVQHRHPGATDRQLYEEGLRLKEICGDAPLFINGRIDLALALEAHLHCTEWSLLPADARPLMGQRWISSSLHSTALSPHPDPPFPSVPSAPRPWPVRGEGGTFFIVSPVFDPISKAPERPAIGIDGFHAAARSTSLPCFALGGITAERVPLLGPIAGVAVIGEVMHAASPAHAAEALLRALG